MAAAGQPQLHLIQLLKALRACWWSAPTSTATARRPGSATLLSTPDPTRTGLLQQSWRALTPKLIHRTHPDVEITDGNHEDSMNGIPIAAIKSTEIEILHVPIRSYEQLERKIRQGAGPCSAINAWPRRRRQLAEDLRQSPQKGTLPAYYDSLRPKPAAIAAELLRGELIDDRRLKRALSNHSPGWP